MSTTQVQVSNAPVAPAIIRKADLQVYLQLGRTALNGLIRGSPQNGFPPQLSLGKRAVGWQKSAIDNWIQAQAKQAEKAAA